MTSDAAYIDLVSSDAALNAGDPTSNADFAFDGEVDAVGISQFSIRPVGESSDSSVTIDALGLDLSEAIMPTALAHVHFVRKCSTLGCSTDIVVSSLDALGGKQNPAKAASGLYVAADDGGGLAADLGYSVDHVRLPCTTDLPGGCGGTVPGLYAMKFSTTSGFVVVDMGDTGRLALGSGSVSVHDLRSYIEGYCNENTNWADWVADAR